MNGAGQDIGGENKGEMWNKWKRREMFEQGTRFEQMEGENIGNRFNYIKSHGGNDGNNKIYM